MVEQTHLDAVFQALADPTRRHILSSLEAGETSISALAEPLDMSLAGASKHVQVLERAGLVRRRKVGRQHLLALEAKRLREAHDWLDRYARFWTTAFDALEKALDEEEST